MTKRVSLLLCSCLLVGGLVATGCEKAQPTKPEETVTPDEIAPADANKAPEAPDANADANTATDAPKGDAPKADAPKGAPDPNVIAPK